MHYKSLIRSTGSWWSAHQPRKGDDAAALPFLAWQRIRFRSKGIVQKPERLVNLRFSFEQICSIMACDRSFKRRALCLPKDFQWLNVYDPIQLQENEAFSIWWKLFPATTPGHNNYKASEPIDISYKAGRFHLPSHLEYLTFSKSCHTRLVDMLLTGW